MNRIKLRDSIYVLKESGELYKVIFTGTRRVKTFRVDELTKEVINELTDEKDEQTLLSELSRKYDKETLLSCINALESSGIAKRYDRITNERYSRQLSFIDEMTESWNETLEIQKRLEDSIVSVFGVGGIGTWIVNGLNQIGIGEIRVDDPDVVQESNLNRQLFFDYGDIGEYKVDVIRKKLPDANIKTSKRLVSPESNLEDMVGGSTFLVNCADTPSVAETTRIIDEYAQRHNIPYCVSGGYNMHLGMVGPIIIPGESSTFDDFLESQKKSDSLSKLEVIKDIENPGNIGPIAGAVANLQVMEIFKYITGKGNFNKNKFAEIDFMNLEVDWRYF